MSLDAAIIVGHSMGASVAQRFAIDYPVRALGLALVGAAAAWRDNPAVVALANEVVSTLADPVDREFVRDFQQSTLAQPVPDLFLDMVVRESLKVPARVWRAAFRDTVLKPDFSAELRSIRTPTLVVCGDKDAFAGDQQARLVAAIAGARRVIYDRAGHSLHWEEPQRFATDLVRFAASVVAGEKARFSPLRDALRAAAVTNASEGAPT